MKRRGKKTQSTIVLPSRGRILRVLFCLTSGPNANEPCEAAKIAEILNQNSCGFIRGLASAAPRTERPSGVVEAKRGGTRPGSNTHIGSGTTEAACCQFDRNRTAFLRKKKQGRAREDFAESLGFSKAECDWPVLHTEGASRS